MPFVYILKEKETQRKYIGSCVDLETRLSRHKSHTGGSTTKTGEWNLFCFKEIDSLDEARKLEKLLKSYKGGNSFKKEIENWKRG